MESFFGRENAFRRKAEILSDRKHKKSRAFAGRGKMCFVSLSWLNVEGLSV